MPLIWSNAAYGTGVPKIDAQHKELFKRINSLLETSVLGEDAQEINRLLVFLDSYVRTHFKDEEVIMERCRCSSRAANRDAHQYFLKGLEALKKTFKRAGATPTFITGVQGLMVDWFRNHVIKIDCKLRDTLPKSRPAKQRAA